jgi:hypothetical protein
MGSGTMSFILILYNKLAVSYGDFVVAASSITSKAQMAVIMIVTGISMGIQPFIDYNYGARNYRRLFSGIKVSIILGTGTCLLYYNLFWLCRPLVCPVVFLRSASDNSRDKDDEPGDFWSSADGGTNDVYDLSAIYRTSCKSNDCESKPSMFYSYSVLFVTNFFFKLNGFLLSQLISDIATTILAISLVFRKYTALGMKTSLSDRYKNIGEQLKVLRNKRGRLFLILPLRC